MELTSSFLADQNCEKLDQTSHPLISERRSRSVMEEIVESCYVCLREPPFDGYQASCCGHWVCIECDDYAVNRNYCPRCHADIDDRRTRCRPKVKETLEFPRTAEMAIIAAIDDCRNIAHVVPATMGDEYERFVEVLAELAPEAISYLPSACKNFENILRTANVPLCYVPHRLVSRKFYLDYAKTAEIAFDYRNDLPIGLFTEVVRIALQRGEECPIIRENDILEEHRKELNELQRKALTNHPEWIDRVDTAIAKEFLRSHPEAIELSERWHLFDDEYTVEYVAQRVESGKSSVLVSSSMSLPPNVHRSAMLIELQTRVPDLRSDETNDPAIINAVCELLRKDSSWFEKAIRQLDATQDALYAKLVDAACEAPTLTRDFICDIDWHRVDAKQVFEAILRKNIDVLAFADEAGVEFEKYFYDALENDPCAIAYADDVDVKTARTIELDYTSYALRVPPSGFMAIDHERCSPELYCALACRAVESHPKLLKHLDEANFANDRSPGANYQRVVECALEANIDAIRYIPLRACSIETINAIKAFLRKRYFA